MVEVVRAKGLEIAYERVADEDHRAWHPQLTDLADEFTVVAWRRALL